MGKKGGKGVGDEDWVVHKQRGGKSAKGRRDRSKGDDHATSDMEDDLSSYVSNLSYQNIIDHDSQGEGSMTGESGIEDNDVLDQQLDVSLEAAALKNTVVRTKNLKIIEELFTARIMGDNLFRRKGEMVDVIIKSLKSGKGSERFSTAHLAVLFTLQLGDEPDLETFFNEIKPLLLSAIGDANIDVAVKAKIIFRLSVLCFLCSDNSEDRKELMALFRERLNSKNIDILINTMASVSLILTICSPTERNNALQMLFPTIRSLLKDSNVDVRIEAGELIAHLFELGRDYDEDFDSQIDNLEEMLDVLEGLSTDSAKFRAKRDRKVQRCSFRQILAFLNEEGDVNEHVKVSLQETLVITSWSERVQYGAIKEILGPATSFHLQQNSFVRDIFGLGAVPLKVEKITKSEKHEMKKLNAACHKARQKNMLKQRDKRMIF